MTAKKDKRLARRIWGTLSALDVNEHTDKKGKFTYLSWSWAWATMMEQYPQTDYTITLEPYSDGTMQVLCEMTVSEGDERVTRNMWQAVMDNRNNAIKNPNACDINKGKMRCLVKTMAMFGLGHYIYAGEDLPEDTGKVAPSDALVKAQVIIRKAYEKHGDSIYNYVDKELIQAQEESGLIQAAGILSSNKTKTSLASSQD
ncbi:hypothetical protein CMI37_30240 [Candidatus Pacearchaeota archaeon]|nr:hypothetical protein [Candidatus Pacearchaeota archaeon]|tara:strand:+ start:872 stop:1474 length:603 start_codon:yes stop_codon:yes gene_type:complete